MTTAKNITDGQIRALCDEAGQAGDLEMVAICNVALYGLREIDRAELTADQLAAIKGLRKPAARARCAEVIAYAQGRS